MGKLLKGTIGVGAGAALFVAGNLAPKIFEEDVTSSERVVGDVTELAKNCGSTALKDALGNEIDATLSPVDAQASVQKQVDEQMAACIADNIVKPIIEATSGVGSPQVGIEWKLTEGEG